MRAEQLPQLAGRLTELAEYYGSKPPTKAALNVWADALEKAGLDDVLFVLTDWPKTRAKFPLASEVLTLVNDRVSKRIEESSKRDAAETIDKALARAASQRRGPESQRIFEEEMAKIRAITARGKPHPRSWMDRLRAREADGEILNAGQRFFLEEAEKRVFGSAAAAAAARRRGITAVKRSTADEAMDEAALEARQERDAMQADGA